MVFSLQSPSSIAFLVVFLAVIIVIGLFVLYPSRSSQTVSASSVRKASAAGTFYPSDAVTLKTQIEKSLNSVPKISLPAPLRILIVPHAGLDYSGGVAAVAFKQLADTTYKKIILVGPSHHHLFAYAALDTSSSWQTPLGTVDLDSGLAGKILSPDLQIIADPAVNSDEHSLEVEVLFLQQVLPGAKIVPVLLSNPGEELISTLAFRIAENMDADTLLVISSDLSHYPDYGTAVAVDKKTTDAIIAGNMNYFDSLPAGVETLACGFEAIRVAVKVSGLLSLNPPQLLKYANSGDVGGDRSRVVGYGALAFTGSNYHLTVPRLSPDAKKAALALARTTLTDFVRTGTATGSALITNGELFAPLGAFVTLRKKGELRGCIGEFEPDKPLYRVIQEKTVAAASADPRFNPVTADELPDISLEISVMTPKTRIQDWHSIQLGTDGVVIVSGNNSGTFLPQVATDTGWKLEEFLSHLCTEKAGLPADCYKSPAAEIYTFQAQVFD